MVIVDLELRPLYRQAGLKSNVPPLIVQAHEYGHHRPYPVQSGHLCLLGEKCHRIHLRRQVKADTSAGSTMRVLGYQQEFWISTGATMPMPLLAYAYHTRLAVQGDTMQQYQGFRLEEYKVYPNSPAGGIDTGFNPIFRYKAPKPDEPLPTLANGTEAPDFLLKTLDGTKADLRSFRGKVVLVDFFYRSCYPCMLAIPGLQEMHHRWHDSGLVVLGVNPFDTAGTVLKRFLSGRGVTYPILSDADKSVVNTWKVRAYPTLYLIDRRGNIRYNQIGYSKETEEGIRAKVAERVDAQALGSCGVTRESSSLSFRTTVSLGAVPGRAGFRIAEIS